ncbi:MAG TPA: phosphoribosyl-AMP cyclohydrolase, partial [bacterium]|nr:phosphoribosyl-AMP cyclohydrolase [bacterium]
DCDKDAILVKIEQVGEAACHTGKRSCFFNELSGDNWKEVGVQIFDPEKVYGKK